MKRPEGWTPRQEIKLLRAQMLVHSFIYYEQDDSIISDDDWQKRANRLAKLQSKYGTKIGFYDDQFAEWDGTTGHHLKFDDWVRGKALELLRKHTNG
jgi:NAD-dependent DNA ligase